MNTGLGLSFWRIVNEEGLNGWAQIYARIPFDEVELRSRGSLFGVVFGENTEGWAEKDAELMAWVEEYFNKSDKAGDLSEFTESWHQKYPDLSGVWVWISLVDEKRELRVARWGEGEAILFRNEKKYDFSKNLSSGKIIKGSLNDKDKLIIWSGKVDSEIETTWSSASEEDISKWNKKLSEEKVAFAGLVLNFGNYSESVSEKNEEEVVGRMEAEKSLPMIEPIESLDLAENKLIGPIGIKEKIINWWMKIRPVEQKGLWERNPSTGKKRWPVFLGVVFLILLIISLVSGSIKIRKDAELKKWQAFAEPIEKTLSEANSLVTINPTGAKKLIEEARNSFETGKGRFANSKYNETLASLEKKINEGWTTASGEKESQIEEVLKIDLVRQGFKGSRMGLIKEGQFFVLDSSMGVVMQAEVKTKDIKVVAGKGEGLGWIDVIGETNKIMVLNSGGVRNAVTGADLIKFDAAVVKPVALGSFGGNIYVLDQGNREIYKFAAIGEGFGDRARWLKQNENMSVEPVDMAMDVDIWIVSESGVVERFRRGAKESFSLSGVPGGVKITRLAVDKEGTGLALLDNRAGMIILCSKETGVCNQILKSSSLIQAMDIEYDGKGTLMVLAGGVVGMVK